MLMKKFLLSMAAMTVAIGSFAEVYRLGDVVDPSNLTEGEHQVIFKVKHKGVFGFLHAEGGPGDASQVYFGFRDVTKADDSTFEKTFVYTINVDANHHFTIKNCVGGYAPGASIAGNALTTPYYSDTAAENAGSFSVLYGSADNAPEDYYMLSLEGFTGSDHREVHLNDKNSLYYWTYVKTGSGGLQNPGSSGVTVAAFKMYKAEVVEPREMVTKDNISTKIVDGAVITLQCQDIIGGVDHYFNGAGKKSSTFQYSNWFKVVAADEDGGFYLQQITSGKYVGGSATGQVQLVAEQAEANKFTVGVADNVEEDNDWKTNADGAVIGENTIRFSTTNNMKLNTAEEANPTRYGTGTGGFSVWCVYAYTAEGVLDVVLADIEAWVASAFKDDVPGCYPLNSASHTAVTAAYEEAKALADGWEVITLDAVFAAREAIFAAQNEEEVALDGIFNGVYTITNKDASQSGGSRGYLCYIEDDDNRLWSSGKSVEGVTIPAKEDVNSQWAFVEIDGKRYLFNVGVKKFVAPTGSDSNSTSNPWEFSNEKAGPITLVVSKDGAGSVEIRSVEGENDETCYMSISNNHNDPVAGYYTATDGGAPFVFERVSDLTEELRSEMETMKPTPTAIHEIGAVAEGTPEYYDLNGRRVAQPANGLFIMRQGDKVSKVIL